MVGVLPFVARERCFALKGGTAINLFVRDLPRLSVDIDLAYLPVGERAAALREIDAAFQRIKRSLEGVSPAYGAEVPVLSFEDLYAGKIVAALDRQHPRDLFDAKLLLGRKGSPSGSSAPFSSTSSATTARSLGWSIRDSSRSGSCTSSSLRPCLRSP